MGMSKALQVAILVLIKDKVAAASVVVSNQR
jgi:hypothetical protein